MCETSVFGLCDHLRCCIVGGKGQPHRRARSLKSIRYWGIETFRGMVFDEDTSDLGSEFLVSIIQARPLTDRRVEVT